MSSVRPRWVVLVLSAVVLCASSIPGARPQFLPASLETGVASAQIIDGGNFGSAVPCLEAPDQFVTACFANTLVSDADSNGHSTSPVVVSDTALVRFNSSGKTPLANFGQIGSVYGMAYDDGSASGIRRVLIGAFAHRMTGYGPGGAGAIYQYNLATGSVSLFAAVPGTTNRHVLNDTNDDQIAPWVGKSSLGDLEIGPSGTTLYAMNLDTRQIERFDLRTGARLSPLSITMAAISSDPAVQTDLRPFALEFQPATSSVQPPYVYVGIVDSGERSPNNVYPTAYIVAINPLTGDQITVLAQPLNATAIVSRFNDGVNAGQAAWHAWTPTGKNALWPMPIVSDIQWSRDGSLMLLGLRDRNGDVYQADLGDQWWRVQEQGDVLAYRNVGGTWALQTRAGAATASDFFRDNYVGVSSSTAHVENFMGALALTLTGSGAAAAEQVIGTAITPLQGGTAGANWYNLRPDAYDRQAAVEIFPGGDLWKSATLGDLENLCTVAYIGDRVWNDANGNGIQEAGEAGIGGVLLRLLDSAGTPVAQATTDAAGSYLFAITPGRTYSVEVAASNFAAGGQLFNLVIAPQNRGGDDSSDSDADQVTRRVAVPAQYRDAYTTTFDIGVMSTVQANGKVGNFVWNDLNANGVQEGNEPGIGAINIYLISAETGSVTAATKTDNTGNYQFSDIIPGTYIIEFAPPAGVSAAPRDAGGNDALDSDADARTAWRTPPFTVIADTVDRTFDLGLLLGANVWAGKSGPATAITGDQIDYTLSYGNSGAATASGVALVDTLPSGLSYVSANPAPSSISGQTLTWNLGGLPPGGAAAAGSIAVRVQVDATAPASATNLATISTATNGDDPSDNTAAVSTAILRPNVVVHKLGPAVATAGEQLTYTLAYSNTGDAPAASVVLADTLPPDLAFVSASPAPASASGALVVWQLGTLAPGQRGTITLAAQASPQTANGVAALNQATISTATPGDAPGDNTSEAVTVLQRADVRVGKSSPTIFPVVPGQAVSYDIDYANAGPATARDVMLSDAAPPQLSTLSWRCVSGCAASGSGDLALALGDLAPGATGRVVVSGLARTSAAREDFVNTATIASSTAETDLANNQSSAPGAVWTSDVQLIKLAQPRVLAGETFTATLLFKNNGPAPAASVTLSDTLPPGAAYVSASPTPASASGTALAWDLGPLADGQSGSVALLLRADTTLPDGTMLLTQARIDTATADRDAANNTSSAATLALARADLAANKSGPARADAGDLLSYTLAYRNNGPALARGVLVTDTLPPDLAYVSASPPPSSSDGGTLSWALGELAPGEAGTISLQARASLAQDVPRRDAANTLRVGSATADPNPADNTSTAVTAIETADLAVVKRSPAFIVAGAPFTVTLDYANAGPAAARDVTLRDLLPAGLELLSASPPPVGPGPRWRLGDLPAGAAGSVALLLRAPTSAISGTTYTNVATIDAPSSADRDPANDASSTVSTAQAYADLALLKRGPAGPIRSGDMLTYTLSFRNNGPSQAMAPRVRDTLPPGFSLREATPAPALAPDGALEWDLGALGVGTGGTITVTGKLFGDGAAATRVNSAAIDSGTPDPQPANNTSSASTLVQQPDLSVQKSDGQASAQPGDTLSYTLTLRNTGAASASGVLLRETPPPGALVLAAGWAAQADGSYTLALGDMPPGAVATRQFALRLPNPLPNPSGPIVNSVLASDDGSAGADPTPDDNTSSDADTPLAGQVGDTIWYDKDGDGQQEAGESGLGDVVVQLLDASGAVLARAATDQSGRYLFGGLRLGVYGVSLAPATTQSGLLRGFRYTTSPTPLGAISAASPSDLALDIGLHDPGSTDVVLAYLRAEQAEDGAVTLRWRTLDETNTARFRVLRGAGEQLANAAPFAVEPSRGSAGGDYRVADAHPPSGARYWLVEVERGGKETAYGPLRPQPLIAARSPIYLPVIRR